MTEYQTTVDITSEVELTDYTISLTLFYTSDIEMREDFADIRFYIGETELGYYIREKTDGDSATFDILIPTINDGTTVLTISADTSRTTTTSNSQDAYLFFDDGQTDGSEKYTISGINIDGAATTGTLTYDGTNKRYSLATNGNAVPFLKIPALDGETDIELRVDIYDVTSSQHGLMLMANAWDNGNFRIRCINNNSIEFLKRDVSWISASSISISTPKYKWRTWIASIYGTSYYFSLKEDSYNVASSDEYVNDETFDKLYGIYLSYTSGNTIYFKNIKAVRTALYDPEISEVVWVNSPSLKSIINIRSNENITSLTSIINVRENIITDTLKSIINISPNENIASLKSIIKLKRLWTTDLTVQGTVLGDNPTQPPKTNKLIYMTVNDVIFPDMGVFAVETRGNDQNTTFTITYNSEEDLLIFSGQIIKLIELHGDPDGFFTGIIQKITEDDTTGERVWTITGRNEGNPLVTQGFHIDAVSTDPTSFTSNQWINMILFGTNVKLGPCADLDVGGIVNQNDVWNGFAGNFTTKAAALTSLLAVVSKLRGRNVSWFLDKKGLLRIFYTDVPDSNIGISISQKNPRILSKSIEENGEGIINSQRGTGGKDNEFKVQIQDENSRNGWTDTETGLSWPGYGFRPGTLIQDNAVTNSTDLSSKVQNILDIHSMPIFIVNLTFSRLPDVQIGQPIYLIDHYKLEGKTLVITSISMAGNTSERSTRITATTDKTILGPLSDYEAVKTVAKQAIQESAPFYGVVIDKGDGNVSVQPVNDVATINAKDLSI